MNRVFVLSKDKKILAPCKSARARILLTQKRAAVFRRYPFTIIMKDETKGEVTQKIEHKIDPGQDTSGHALVSHFKRGNVVIFKMNLKHRGFQIKKNLLSRKTIRRNRRSRKTRYREARFLNRRKPEGWLPPSVLHIVQTNLTWANRFQKIANITDIHVETNRFDTQKMMNPEISGIEYCNCS